MTDQNIPVSTENNENIKIMWLLQLAGILVPHVWWWILVLIFYIFKKDSFNPKEKEVFTEIMNFNISFLIYAIVSWILIILLIWLLLLPIVFVVYAILLIISTIKLINGSVYKYPLTIKFL